ncbi:biosynthetic arginine decarboxylase [Ningiella sp. W23]|uniref:biosynthetic arginine decarboxylase n=1 Tax=Ningiella sp. W23 TaxID=3023715 RepID=UPI00375665E6
MADGNISADSSWTIQDAERVYGVSSWGGGYFQIGDNGNVHVVPTPNNNDVQIDMKAVIDEIRSENIQFPVVIRFHDVLRSQVINLNETFIETIKEAKYEGHYRGVYPIKVNQMREVVEEIVDAGNPYAYGLEAGSKPELLAVLAYNTNTEALTILNGYKDEEFIKLALLGRKLGRKVVVVIEKFSELQLLIKVAKELNIEPIVGLRAKMQSKGQGRWQGSSGERAKFGLSISEIINAARLLQTHGMADTLKLLHFHIGSQLPEIRAIKDAVNESARIYAELVKMGFRLEYVDVGGGLGIDYDGSKSTADSSRNYSLQEYVADVIYGMREVCDLEGVPHPHIVTESGRAITAHHSCVITEVVGEIKPDGASVDLATGENEHVLLKNMRELSLSLQEQSAGADEKSSLRNYQEIYNDATQYKEQASDAFGLRVIGLEELGKIETLYWQIMRQVQHFYRHAEFVPEEVQSLDFSLSSQYLCNFSIFQSAVDSWAIDQILPVVPITGLHTQPVNNGSLVDITCDSDGKIDRFVIEHAIDSVLPMPAYSRDEPFYLGLFLTGAYQDVMGDMHNLFGRLNEVHIFSYDDDPQDFYIEEFVRGSNIDHVLSVMQYHPSAMAIDVKKLIDKEVSKGNIKPREGVKWTDFYENSLSAYTYLNTD